MKTRITVKAVFQTGPLRAVLDIVLDDTVVVKDIRVVESYNKMIVAMPCRQAVARCTQCRAKNIVSANFCNECGASISRTPIEHTKIFVDVVHPITPTFREQLNRAVLAAYAQRAKELELAPV